MITILYYTAWWNFGDKCNSEVPLFWALLWLSLLDVLIIYLFTLIFK